MNLDVLPNEPNGSPPSNSSSVFSYESSEEEGHFSYSDLSPEYDKDDFDLTSGFKKLRINDDKDEMPVQYHRSGPIKPIFSFDTISSLRKIHPDYFWNIRLTPHNKTICFDSLSNPAKVLAHLYSKVAVRQKKYIDHLSVNFVMFYHYPDKEFYDIIRFFTKSFPATKYLYLNFAENISRYREDEDLIWLGLHISKNMPNLKHFVLQFDENDSISSEGFRLFCRHIAKRSKRLEFLSLNFSKCQGIKGRDLKSITRYLSTCLPLLKDLRLNFHITAEIDIEKISINKTRCLKKLDSLNVFMNPKPSSPSLAKTFHKDLHQLSFQFNIDSHVLTGLDKLSSSCLQPAENLRFVNLDLSNLSFSEERTRKFVETLNSKIKTLDRLRINFFSGTHIFQAFLRFLHCPEQNQLQRFELGFDSCDLYTIRGMPVKLFDTFTSNFLQRLKNLAYLDLRLQTLPIKDMQIKSLTSCIAKELVSLEFLYIYFFLCPKITDESVKAFQEDFCSENALPNLKALILTFSNCRKITKKPIKSLRSALKKRNPAIESVTVNFIDYLRDPNYRSSDDEDHDIAKCMEASLGSECKAIKINPTADPESQDNWRFIRREEYEAESSYDESDGADGDASTGSRERGWWRRIEEDREDDEYSESYEEDEEGQGVDGDEGDEGDEEDEGDKDNEDENDGDNKDEDY